MEELEKLERRVPIVSDKALINLVNGIQVNSDLIQYQRQQGFFGRLFDNNTPDRPKMLESRILGVLGTEHGI